MAGSIVGTVHYMAPEQARGQDVDQRADIYAFGLIVYDMLLGRRRAEQADSAVGELEARMKQAPPSVRSVAPEIPVAVDALVSRCLDPDQAKRFQTTAELVAALDRLDENGELLPITTRRGPAAHGGGRRGPRRTRGRPLVLRSDSSSRRRCTSPCRW